MRMPRPRLDDPLGRPLRASPGAVSAPAPRYDLDLRRVGITLVVAALAGAPRAAPSEDGPNPDASFALAFQERLPSVQAAVDQVTDCMQGRGRYAIRGRGACFEVEGEALEQAREAAALMAGAKVSARLEPSRVVAESGFGLVGTAMGHMQRFHRTARRDALDRAEGQLLDARDLLLGAAALLSSPPGGPAPSRERVQRDVARHVASLRADGVRVEDVFVTFVIPEGTRKDAAVAYARGDTDRGGSWARWRLVLSYRKGHDGWVLERLSVSQPR